MKKVLTIVGLVIVVASVVIGGIKYQSAREAAQYEATAVPYIKMVVPELSTWDPQIIKSYMPAESLESTPEQRIIQIVDYLSRLGSLKSLAEPEFQRLYTYAPVDAKKKQVVTYEVAAVYANGDASITISLIETSDSFKVYKFDINSLALQD